MTSPPRWSGWSDAGGHRLFDHVERFGRARVIYVADPDGNVIELLDSPLATIAAETIRMFPEAAPGDGHSP